MTEIKVKDNKDKSLESLAKGIKVKDNNEKIRIAGAFIRVQVVAKRNNGYRSNDYKFEVVLPNGKRFEVDDEHSMGPTFRELMETFVEAATGTKPQSGSETKTIMVFGVPMKVSDWEDKSTEKIDSSVDPLEEKLTEVSESAHIEGHSEYCPCYGCKEAKEKAASKKEEKPSKNSGNHGTSIQVRDEETPDQIRQRRMNEYDMMRGIY